MNIHDDRKKYFEEFRNNIKPVYMIFSGSNSIKEIPQFVFRKIDDIRIAILAWREKGDAEEWRLQKKLDNTRVVEISHSDFKKMLDELTPEQRKGYSIELI